MKALMDALEQRAEDFEAASVAYALEGIVQGHIAPCGCPAHALLSELQVDAIERRN